MPPESDVESACQLDVLAGSSWSDVVMSSFMRKPNIVLCWVAVLGLTIPGCSSSAKDYSEGDILYQSGEFVIEQGPPLELDREFAEAVSRAVDKYTVSPDVDDCSDLAQWYVDGLEVVLEGEILEILRNTSSTDVATQSLPRVSIALKEKMVETLRRNRSLCPREPNYQGDEIAALELEQIAQEALGLMEKTGVYFSIDAPTVLRLAIDAAEGRPRVFEYNRNDIQPTDIQPRN